MNRFITIIILLCPIVFQAQDLKPDSNNALIDFTIQSFTGEMLETEITFYSQNTKKEYHAHSNNQGKGKVLLPINDTYTGTIPTSADEQKFSIPNYPRLTLDAALVYTIANKDELQPTATLAVVNFTIKNSKKQAVIEEITIESTTKDFEGVYTTNENGFASVQVPINKSYTVSFTSAQNYATFTIPNTAYYILDKGIFYEGSGTNEKFPTIYKALINVYYWDVDKNPIANESIIAKSTSTMQEYKAVTDANGRAQILVPLGQSYNFSAKYHKNFQLYSIADDQTKHQLELHYTGISSLEYERQQKQLANEAARIQKEWDDRQKELEQIKAERDRQWKEQQKIIALENARKDSLRKIDSLEQIEIEKEIAQNQAKEKALAIEQAKQDSLEKIRLEKLKQQEIAQKKAQRDSLLAIENQQKEKELIWKAEYETNNDVWQTNKVVFKVMKRNNWDKQLIVIDVTGSMTPYAQEIKNWYILNFAQNDTAHFAFFNDGNNTPDIQKQIGKTGGVYLCQDCSIVELENEYTKAAKYSGGDTPENDLEALLLASQKISKYKELILIADNNSNVRDYELLEMLNIPVRIILCGVVDDMVNPQYINIAYNTKGSVHTISQDISLLKRVQEKDFIFIGARKYMYVSGRFLRVR